VGGKPEFLLAIGEDKKRKLFGVTLQRKHFPGGTLKVYCNLKVIPQYCIAHPYCDNFTRD